MRLAIIGCGSIGTRHLKNALALGCEVVVCDEDEVKVERALSLGASLDLMDTDYPADAYVIATPYDQHLKWATYCVQYKHPVFVEKPLGSLDQIEDWRALVMASEGLTTQVGYQCRFHPRARAMKLLFPEPECGTFSCHVDMGTWPGKAYGPLWLEASHDLDMALWMGARPVVTWFNEYGAGLGVGWSIEIRESDHYRRCWSVGVDDEGVSVEFDSPEELGDQMYLDELAHFLSCVQSGKQTDVPLSDGLRVLEVCAQVEEMARANA